MAHVSDLIGKDIEAYLHAHEHKSQLRFITCGSVDDGKSTLIGRLLYDSKLIFEDQLAALEADSKKVGTQGGELDFALLVDGLAAEREQGITIDVAYRYFSTDKRKFIVADTPGHEQYTRNMVTGASTADLAVLLIDARKGVLTQTRRHSYLVSLLGIRKVVLAINKMDLVDYSREIFETILAEYLDFASQIDLHDVVAIPVSGLRGDNVTQPSAHTPWYHGPTLMGYLETVEIEDHLRITPDVQQTFAGCFRNLVHPLKFKSIKPNAATTSIADIDHDVAHLDGFQSSTACRAVHTERRYSPARGVRQGKPNECRAACYSGKGLLC